MDQVSRPPSAEPGTTALDTRKVAGKGKRKRRKRTATAGTVRRINAKARERHAIKTERAPMGCGEDRAPILSEAELLAHDVTRGLRADRLSGEIDDLYTDLRELRKGQ
jgi:hypothetical protein